MPIPNPWRPERPEVQPTTLPLRVIDRCDRCGARAAVRATHLMSVLLFFGHHAMAHEPRLKGEGWRVERPPLAGQ